MTNGNFSENLRECMKRANITGRRLAELADTTEATISRYLSGERCPEIVGILPRLAAALGVSCDFLLGATNNPFSKANLPPEVKSLLTLYLRADEADRRVLWAILDKYA